MLNANDSQTKFEKYYDGLNIGKFKIKIFNERWIII